jgi:hypothetical protein
MVGHKNYLQQTSLSQMNPEIKHTYIDLQVKIDLQYEYNDQMTSDL